MAKPKPDPVVEKKEIPPTIEELQETCNTPKYIFVGVCTSNGWNSGKRITQGEYQKAVSTWLKSPMKGR